MTQTQGAKRNDRPAKSTSDSSAASSTHPPLALVLRSSNATENGPFPPVPIRPLTRTEKRFLLAQIVRLNPLDCLDDSGAFDLDRARHTLPACAVQELIIDETTRTDRDGNVTSHRKIRVRLVDKIRALKLDDLLERQMEKDREKENAKEANKNPKQFTQPTAVTCQPSPDDLPPLDSNTNPDLSTAGESETETDSEAIPYELKKNPPSETREEVLARTLIKDFPEADPASSAASPQPRPPP